MGSKRKSREKIRLDGIDKLKPLDLLSLGTKEDLCFGKHHSLSAPECIMCGDSEFCSIVMAQNLHKDRLKIEANQDFKDLDEAEEIEIEKIKKAKKYLKHWKETSSKKMKIILKTIKKFNLTKDKVKELYEQI